MLKVFQAGECRVPVSSCQAEGPCDTQYPDELTLREYIDIAAALAHQEAIPSSIPYAKDWHFCLQV